MAYLMSVLLSNYSVLHFILQSHVLRKLLKTPFLQVLFQTQSRKSEPSTLYTQIGTKTALFANFSKTGTAE
jgi:hypothetical protein